MKGGREIALKSAFQVNALMPMGEGTQLNLLERYVLSTHNTLSIQQRGLLFDLFRKMYD